ncbi:MAG TPA: phosphatidate cytidylyltransferase [Dyella sp.]|uniref:phosphatidate cytidylyltransferase n=1 Tax=Dyella sp. TaxID=1869338 RepID=UPI002F92DEF1
MLQRVITALLLFPFALLLILWPPTAIFAPLVAIAFLAALWEWTSLCGIVHVGLRFALLAASAAIFVGLWWLRDSAAWPAIVIVGLLWWIVACLWLRHFAFGAAPTRENRLLKLAAGALIVFPAWVAALMIRRDEPHGHWWVFLALAIVWAADIGAYFSGRLFGKRKLAPTISPGKTWAGVYGALVGGALVAGIGGNLLGVSGVKLGCLVVLSLFTVVASIVGDLLESLMKRHAAVKDSGRLFPGHGGLLDRLDSVFAALPVFAAGKFLLGL